MQRARAMETVTSPAPLDASPGEAMAPGLPRVGLSLFWRTFFLLSLLLIGSIIAWLQTFRALEFTPRALQTAQQIASLVNLSRAALVHSDAIARVSLIKTLADQERVQIQPREPGDRTAPVDGSVMDQAIVRELLTRLGPGTELASRVNGEAGLWVGFRIENDAYWLRLDRERFANVGGRTWLIWLVTAAGLSLAGAALIARLINRPLKQLSFAASRVRDGDFDASRLDEQVATSEIREVNIGFNRMAQQLAKIEQDRAVMLAGISHDLRTPLARLRLETEMSVADRDARDHMAADIDQLDAIIDKFLDYARPDHTELKPVRLADVVQTCLYALQEQADLRFRVDIPGQLEVLADEVELARVMANLLENARRYGKSADTGVAEVEITARGRGDWVLVKVRDHGPGVAPEALPNLMKPFFRGDAARTEATGAGLGLAIVDKTVQRMGGVFAVANSSSGGFSAHIKLQRPHSPPVAEG
ncbi:ATP-binding protein [Ramlibacter sp. MAHUQ-53]|uniref:sensor histidine kinase n=1 Tax=unclassified Ramlibacter TaxID=2617605 RepID=UPI0036393FB0